MQRRDFIRSGAALTGAAVFSPWEAVAAEANRTPLPRPTPGQIAWQDCEVGVIYHFDLPVAAGDVTGKNRERKTFDPNLYQPRHLDTDQWIEAAKACGANYALFTATHFNGFMQWQSDLYPYGLKQTKWRGGRADVVGDFVTSCRRAGIKPGIYFSVHRNVYQQVWSHYTDWGKGRGTPAQERYNRIAEQQMTELCSRYGPLVQIWFDAGTKTPAEGGPDMVPIFDRHQPQSVFYSSTQRADHRWVGNEKGHAGYPCWATMPRTDGLVSHNAPTWKPLLYHGDPEGAVWSPAMVDVPLRGANKVHSWFWAPNQDYAVEPLDRLVQMYLESVGRNGNFVLGEVVTSDGVVPDIDIRRLAEFGREVQRRWGKPLAQTTGRGTELELRLPQPARVASVAMMEDIAHGERIRQYRLEGLRPGGEWAGLGRGVSIGHKRIETFTPVEVAAIRLRVEAATAEPRIRQLTAFAPAD